MSYSYALSLALFGAAAVLASPTPRLQSRQTITPLATNAIDAFTPYTWYASAAYCAASTTINWSCGSNCQANPDFVPVASGGDGDDTQYWYVGYDPALQTVIVAHQGTNPEEILPLIEDSDIPKESLDSSLFPGVSSSVEAHSGFANEQAKTATAILAAVKKTLAAHGATSVTTVGHSLGAALALLDGIYLPLHLPADTSVTSITYGLPRVGNQDFANYVDAHLKITHINNKEDFVPILPGEFLGFVHPSGEVHITDSDAWEQCPGQDNPSTLCIVGDVPTILEGDESDHDGPYNGVEIGC